MITLGLESSAKAASAAISKDGELVAQLYTRCGLTHSQTLLPMVEAILKCSGLSLADIDRIAVANGPGSFTGVRIGVATVKGLCWGAEKNAVGVSTLAAMAALAVNIPGETLICPVMDARRAQVYNALFESRNGHVVRLTGDRAISTEELIKELEEAGRKVYILGDGWEVFEHALSNTSINYQVAEEAVRYQNAYGVCLAAAEDESYPADELLPVYLRLSQAERERQERLMN